MKKIIGFLAGIGVILIIIFAFLLVIGNRSIEKSIIINAPEEVVWNDFTNLEKHKEWNTFITNFSGELETGNVIAVTVKPPEENPVDFKPVLLVVDENKELRWLGKVGGIPFILDGEHYFILESAGEGKTKFIQGEHLTGILVPFFGGIWDNTEIGFDNMNQEFKAYVEKTQAESMEQKEENVILSEEDDNQ